MNTEIFAPVLTNAQSADFERAYFAETKTSPREVIANVGAKIARCFSEEFGAFSADGKPILAALGSGHNAADALAFLLALEPKNKIVLLAPPREKLKPDTLFYLEELEKSADTVFAASAGDVEQTRFALVVEGLSGMSYRPPMRPDMREKIEFLNAAEADLKISIDVPAGVCDTPEADAPRFRADATYATAIAKQCLFENKEEVGRVRFIDVGFFQNSRPQTHRFAVAQNALDVLAKPRPSVSDKRAFGRLLAVSGSETYAGASLLNAKAAIRGGCGFVYACAPENFKPAFCAAEPSVIWLECSSDENGAHALENFSAINAIARNADAIVCGSGLTRSRESAVLVREILKNNPDLPAVIDADAITAETLETAKSRNAVSVITPHEGEFLRIAPDVSDNSLLECAKKYGCVIMLKSNITRICDGENIAYSTRGSPALARAGSGDILCALAGALLANKNLRRTLAGSELENAAACAALAAQWLGIAAERATAKASETALAASDIIENLKYAIR